MSNYFIMNTDINPANELEIMKATKGKGIDLLNKRVTERVENDKKPINPKTIFQGINKSKIKNSIEIAKIYKNLGIIYHVKGDYENTLSFFIKDLSLPRY